MFIKYLNKSLHIEDIAINNIVKEHKTPFYIYSAKQMEFNLNAFKNAVACINANVLYSVKANSNLSVLKLFNNLGCGFDIVSLGELLRLKEIGCKAEKIVFSGSAKTEEELKEAILYGIKSINIESCQELDEIIELCNKLNKTANIMVRINPNISANTHHKISTGKKDDKFGIALSKVEDVCKKAQSSKHINLLGIACHIGSQIFEVESFKKTYLKMLQIADDLKLKGINITNIDLGGGFGVPYKKQDQQFNLQEFSNTIKEVFENKNYNIYFEPGRFIVANTGLLVSKIIKVKNQNNRNFVFLDSSMADIIRPSLYDAYHEIKNINEDGAEAKTADIVGPICETSDIFHKNYAITNPQKNEFVAIFNAGAYCASMSSNYNSKPLTKELMVLNNKVCIIREQSYKKLFSTENIV